MSSWKTLAAFAAAMLALAGGALVLVRQIGGNGAEAPPAAPGESDAADRRNREIRERDLAILAKADSSSEARISALYRQGRQKVPQARDAALSALKAKSADPALRAACAAALGAFGDPEATEALMKLSSDADGGVRLSAVRALGMAPTPEREKVLRGLLARKGLSEGERVAAQEGLLRISSGPGERAEALGELLSAGAAGETDENTSAVLAALSLAPRDPQLLALLRKKLAEARNEHLMPVSIRHLAAVGDPFIDDKLQGLHLSKDVKIRLAVVQVLNRVCPKSRGQLLFSALREEQTEMVFRAGLVELSRFPEPLYAETLAKLKGEKLPDRHRELIDEELPGMRDSLPPGIQRIDPCDSRVQLPASGR
ncbi:MAG: HEAT repeat domain-containing protein [Bdellovibrionales bacterium]|nr:HEAT repeat domain-containing protein [Bdellovibrionales bacterium]